MGRNRIVSSTCIQPLQGLKPKIPGTSAAKHPSGDLTGPFPTFIVAPMRSIAGCIAETKHDGLQAPGGTAISNRVAGDGGSAAGVRHLDAVLFLICIFANIKNRFLFHSGNYQYDLKLCMGRFVHLTCRRRGPCLRREPICRDHDPVVHKVHNQHCQQCQQKVLTCACWDQKD